MKELLKIENISKIYQAKNGEIEALKDISFTVKQGEFVSIIGPSGCGKSTFLKTLNRMNDYVKGIKITGDVKLDGEDIYDSRVDTTVLRKKVGMVFQQPNPFPMSIYDNVAYAMYIVRATPKHIRRQVPMVLSLVGLSEKAKVYPNELSGGEQQRVALARALVNNPSMIIADEPTGNLDPDTAWEIMTLLNDINARGTTVVVATHAKDIVDKMKKRVIQIEKGEIIRDDKKGGYDSEV